MSSSTKKGGGVGSGQKADRNDNLGLVVTGSKGDSLSSTPSKASKHGSAKKSAGSNQANKNSDSQGNPAILNQHALEALYSATYVEDFIDCNDNIGDDLIRQTTRMFEMGSNYMTYIRELESAMAILLGTEDSDQIIPEQLSSDKKKAVFRLQQVLMTSQDTGDDSLQVMQSIQDYLENKTRQLEVDRKNLAEFCKEQEQDTPFKDPPPPPTERNIKRARRQRHEIYRPSILGPSSLKATSYPEAVSNNTRDRDHHDSPVVSSSRSRDRDRDSQNQSSNQTNSAGGSQSSSDGPNVATNEEHKANGRTSERSGGSSTRNSTVNSSEKGDRDHNSSTNEKGGNGGGSGNTSSSSSKKQSQKNQTQEKRTKKRKAKQSGGNSNSKDDNSPQQYAIDPDEPTYCLCDQVSYGEMIGCDNDLCPIEWFHFSCVTLTTKPKGKWYCPKCRGDRPNVMKPRHIFLKELEKYNREKEEKA